MSAPALCRACGHAWTAPDMPAGRCAACRSPRSIAHPELDTLAIAHIDCDAFYASVEKRDDPGLIDKPVIVGGGKRGVVSACCYIARMYGVHSAMPMFKALKACPEAVVIKPDMEKYVAVGRAVKALMLDVTPLVESLSVDEAFLDLSGTQRLHGGSPARTLVRLVARIETELGVTASVGLSYNKFLAKIASDLDKPRGFSVLGQAEALDFLGRQPVGIMWGVGKAMQRKLAKDGITRVGQLQQIDEHELMRRYGALGQRLARHARGEDDRRVVPQRAAKSVSSETTFERDLSDPAALRRILWRQSDRLSGQLKKKALSGRVVTLKLRTRDFAILTRRRSLGRATQLAEEIYRAALPLLEAEADGRAFRLLGIGVSEITPADTADLPDLLDPSVARRAKIERAMDRVRDKLGRDAIIKGRSLD